MIDPRVKRNIASIKNLESLLSEVAKNPMKYIKDELLRKSLASQNGLAKLSLEEYGICASSINTIKRIADVALDIKYAGLEELRIAALRAIENCTKVSGNESRSKRKDIQAKLALVHELLRTTQQDNWLLTEAFRKSLRQGKNYAAESARPEIIERCRKEQRELLSIFSLRATPTRSENAAPET